ncbi:MAG: glycosyltransferase family 39 protein [Oscillatoria sp. Prado101]|jgi:uncharacterized membrane protein|nr:glycosyltransferase family 39 protein [Oscillatoria sp. Prado101]
MSFYLWKDRQKNHRTRLNPGLRFFPIAVLVLGVYFRFINLDRKIYWHDEAMTLKKISAYPRNAEIFKEQVISQEDFHKSLRLSPEISVIETVKMLSVNDPKQGPLYFAVARLWAQWFGSSIAAIRSLSALISLLVFPCLYWLCLELFQSSLVGWVAVALIAVSPFHVLYAQEARMYSLHTVNILLSSAAFLRAMRLKTKLSWGVYSATITLGLYTHLLFSLVAIGHGITAAGTERSRWSKTFIAYLIATIAGLLTFTPWLFCIVTQPRKVYGAMGWVARTVPLYKLAINWLINTSHLFFDIWPYESIAVGLPFLILATYSIYFISYRNIPKNAGIFVLTLTSITVLTLAVPDLILGGVRSANSRYLIAYYLGLHLSVAYLIGAKLSDISTQKKRHKLWQFIAIALISCGVISCAVSSQAELWWNKYSACKIPAIARIVNQATAPLVIIDYHWNSWNNAGPLSNFINSHVKLILLNESKIGKIPEGYSDVFLFNPSEQLRDSIARSHTFKIVPAYQREGMELFRL